jgi:hypothetical protein
MGEYAEMMLDGSCCSSCGEFIDFDGPGFSQLCPGCKQAERREARVPPFRPHKIKAAPKPGDGIRQGDRMSCPFCTSKVKVVGFGDHMLTVHRDKWPAP